MEWVWLEVVRRWRWRSSTFPFHIPATPPLLPPCHFHSSAARSGSWWWRWSYWKWHDSLTSSCGTEADGEDDGVENAMLLWVKEALGLLPIDHLLRAILDFGLWQIFSLTWLPVSRSGSFVILLSEPLSKPLSSTDGPNHWLPRGRLSHLLPASLSLSLPSLPSLPSKTR